MAIDFDLLPSRLEQERKRLTEELEQLKTGSRSIDEREGNPFSKMLEAATEAFELEKRLALGKYSRHLLDEVEHALHKLKLGTYGLCDSCGQTIDPARLEALPHTSLCLRCKAFKERQGHTGRQEPFD